MGNIGLRLIFVAVVSDDTEEIRNIWKQFCCVEVTVSEKKHMLVAILSRFSNSCVKTPILPMVPDLWDTLRVRIGCGLF
jgi:hypothetical protein